MNSPSKLVAHFGPRDGLHGTIVKFLKTALNFSGPGGFNVVINGLIQTSNERRSNFCSFSVRELKGVF